MKPKKFVGLHAHDGFSAMDGLGYPGEHIDWCRENGLDAWAVTNHGNMNSFGHAWSHMEKVWKSGSKFKFIPGCEMYYHPDLKMWAKDREAARRQKAIEELQTHLVAITDKDDETIDVQVASEEDTSTLTAENEEETKSSKLFDPLNRRHHLVVLPKSSAALERLFGLITRSFKEGFYRFPRIDHAMLKEAAKGDFIVSTACIGGEVSWAVLQELQNTKFDDLHWSLLDDPRLMDRALVGVGNVWDRLTDAVGKENAFLELQFNKLPVQHLANRAIIEFAKRNSITNQIITTCDSHYARPDHWREREIYKKLGRLNYEELDAKAIPAGIEDLKCELYPKNAEQVWDTYQNTRGDAAFYDDEIVSQSIERTWSVAHELIGDIKPDTSPKLPSYTIPEGKTAMEALIEASKEGLISKGLHKNKEYVERLKYELSIIKQKDFAAYFLTMKAILDIARERMLIGAARGSGAGSLVNYVLGITNVDPIKYGLIFERFLSIERNDFPDVDNDVSDRDLLIKLLREKFGEHNVIPISNYNTFKLKSLVKDVSRLYGLEFDEVNQVTRNLERDIDEATKGLDLEEEGGIDITLEEAKKYSKAFQEFLDRHPEIVQPLSVLFKQNKSLGRHAGGVIVSENIGERMPLITSKGELQTPWVEGMAYKHLEKFGWIKFDLLGLETLRILERCIELILKNQGKEKVTFADIREWYEENLNPATMNLDDQKVYENVYHRGNWCGTFQCTNRGAQSFFKSAKPRNIEDLAALTSIYRPGPLGAKVDKVYLKNKENPEEIVWKHPTLKNLLEATYGCVIFQESTMAICHEVAGFPKEELNKVRKMLKPNAAGDAAKAMLDLKEKFLKGCVENDLKLQDAEELWEVILNFSQYGFNKSHAVAYSVLSYYCAYLQTYHEKEWICAYLDSTSGGKKAPQALSEVKKLGYRVVPPDINLAERSWTLVGDKDLMPSFYTLKGVGKAAVNEIMQNRPYRDLKHFFWNEDGTWKHSKFNKGAFETIIKMRALGTLDAVGPGKMFASYRELYDVLTSGYNDLRKVLKKEPKYGEKWFDKKLLELDNGPEWPLSTLLSFEQEITGGFNVEHALPTRITSWLKEKEISALDDYEGRDLYWFLVVNSTVKKSKNGKPYLLLECVSSSGSITKIFCWDAKAEDKPEPYSLAVAEVDGSSSWMSTKMRNMKLFKLENSLED